MPFCPDCGTQNTDAAKFCTKCGFALTGTAQKYNLHKEIPQQPVPQQYIHPINVPAQNTPAFVKSPGFWGSILIFIGFFTNWITIPGYRIGASGFKILTISRSVIEGRGEEDYYMQRGNASGYGSELTIIRILLALILISALIMFLYGLGQKIDTALVTIFKVLPLLIIAGSVVFVVAKVSEARRKFEYENGESGINPSDLFQFFGIGFYLTAIGAIVILFQMARR